MNRPSKLYLNILWHQHQPFYVDPATDQLQGPWVRTHGTKDYYDMAAILQEYPNIHCTINLTSSLLYQLQEYYVKRLAPFLDETANRIDADRYRSKFGGRTDPWIDLALKPTEDFSPQDKKYLLTNVWNAFGVSEVMIQRFPQYRKLRERFSAFGVEGMTVQELREIKFWFFAAHFDPDFLEKPVILATGTTVDITDIVQKTDRGEYIAVRPITEDLCNRIVAETVKILSAIVPLHKKLMFDPRTRKGQIELITTPYYHPILPLLYDSEVAKICQPHDPMPSRFHYPQDAVAHVEKSITYFRKLFGKKPAGMWPAEGSVSQEVLDVFARAGIRWIATDEKILARSRAERYECYFPYTSKEKNLVILFRNTELSDKIGFVYKEFDGKDAAYDFINHLRQYLPHNDEGDRLLTVILDGENAWEWYRYDNDGKNFQHTLYKELSALYESGEIVTTTVTEYLLGNPKRGIPSHLPETLPQIEWLWPGSWINANYDTWIGDEEENQAWEYLCIAREDLEASGLEQPQPTQRIPRKGTKQYYASLAWESLYAAEGSDWFWWYGTDQNAPAGERPFDIGFMTHLTNIYRFARLAGASVPERAFLPIGRKTQQPYASASTMAHSDDAFVTVVFQCDARAMYVRKALYLVGNHPLLGNWKPNIVQMYDDGSHGDTQAGDNVWTLELRFPVGTVLEYKYTNSGPEGEWYPGEEFPALNRRIVVEQTPTGKIVLYDIFGKI